MKFPLTLAALCACLFSTPSVRADAERFLDYYDPHPTNYIGSAEWWEGDALLGDWWGMRNAVDDAGVEISATYTTNIAGNPVGGRQQSVTYTDNTLVAVQLDLEKLVGWDGATFTASGLNRSGQSLSEIALGNQFTVQQIYGGQTAMFYALHLEQWLLDDRVSIKLGRFGTGDDFGSSPLYWLYMNNGIDGNPQGLPVNTQFSAYPWAVWAARVKVKSTEETYAMAGAYQVSDRIFERAYHGVDWSIRSDDGVLLISQFGWTPELFKRPVDSGNERADRPADGKAVNNGKFKTFAEPDVLRGYPGHYWFGAYYSPWSFPQFGTTERARNSYGFYWHADQMVFQETPGSDQGLTLWSAVVLSPQQNIAKLPFQVNGGAVYKGLVSTRDEDFAVLGFVYGRFSDDFADSVKVTGGGDPEYEIVLEAAYKIQLSKFLFIEPDVQWVINPGGTGDIPNALVLGAQCGVTF